jgi:hypothetical protein
MTAIQMPNCWICGRSVSARESEIDKNGFVVHESCYIAKLALEMGQSNMSEASKVVLTEGMECHYPAGYNVQLGRGKRVIRCSRRTCCE